MIASIINIICDKTGREKSKIDTMKKIVKSTLDNIQHLL